MKSKEQIAMEIANNLSSGKKVKVPQGVIDPGLYIGVILGIEAKEKELDDLRKLVQDLYKQALTN